MTEINGLKVTGIRFLTKEEMKDEGWIYGNRVGIALMLSNGSFIYPSQDEEGNGPGAFFMKNADGECFHLYPFDEKPFDMKELH